MSHLRAVLERGPTESAIIDIPIRYPNFAGKGPKLRFAVTKAVSGLIG